MRSKALRRDGASSVTLPLLEVIVARSGVVEGLCHIFVRHTSASLVIQENADPAVLRDLQRFMDHVAPERPSFGPWEHDAEGPDDMPAHLRTILTGVNLSVPLIGGRLALGTWQGIYLFEHRRAPHRRSVALHMMGE